MVATDPDPVPYLIHAKTTGGVHGIAVRGELTMLYGRGGEAKSMLLAALGTGVARGETVAGFECEHGRVTYIDAENGQREIHRRVRKLDVPAEGFEIHEAVGLHIVQHGDVLLAVIEADEPDLLVIDSFRTSMPGADENDSAAQAEAVSGLRTLAQQTDVAIVLLHHSDKMGKTPRGSSAIRDQVSIAWKLSREPGDPDPHRRFLWLDKFRIDREPDERRAWFRISDEFKSIALEAAPAYRKGELQPKRAALTDAIPPALADAALSRPDLARKLGRDPKDGTLRRAVDTLLKSGQITKDGDGFLSVTGTEQKTKPRRQRPGGPTHHHEGGPNGQ